MQYACNIAAIEDLARSEGGVFTTAQAIQLGIPSDALSYSARAGRIERIAHGAYRLAVSEYDGLDELRAFWKLTAPAKFVHEHFDRREWDGITICGPTAAHILDIGDFYAKPYHIATPKRYNSRKDNVRFIRAEVTRDDICLHAGLPITRLETTIVFLVRGYEDPSLVANAFVDAVRRYGSTTLNINRLKGQLGDESYARLVADAGISRNGPRSLVDLDDLGHVAIAERIKR